jgi:hypothetical protein
MQSKATEPKSRLPIQTPPKPANQYEAADTN